MKLRCSRWCAWRKVVQQRNFTGFHPDIFRGGDTRPRFSWFVQQIALAESLLVFPLKQKVTQEGNLYFYPCRKLFESGQAILHFTFLSKLPQTDNPKG